MEWLRRSAAPLSAKVWNEVDEIAGTMFKQTVVARRILDFDGPRGWNHVSTQLGTFKPVQTSQDSGKVKMSVPDVMLLTELRADFAIPWADIDIFERVGPTLESKSIEDAAREMALAEDALLFFGSSASPGVLTARETPRVALSDWSQPGRIVAASPAGIVVQTGRGSLLLERVQLDGRPEESAIEFAGHRGVHSAVTPVSFRPSC